jgi:hypothetical protein
VASQNIAVSMTFNLDFAALRPYPQLGFRVNTRGQLAQKFVGVNASYSINVLNVDATTVDVAQRGPTATATVTFVPGAVSLADATAVVATVGRLGMAVSVIGLDPAPIALSAVLATPTGRGSGL